ncbi:MAG: efflux RND transporter periplasmic adaptor subunit [Candidatus Muiribacteriota bacterium]
MRQFSRIIILILILLISGCTVEEKNSTSDEKNEISALKVRVSTVEERVVKTGTSVIGTAEAEFDITLEAEVEGRVINVFKSEGDLIVENEIIASIDDSDIKLRMEQIEIKIRDAKSEVEMSKIHREEKLLELERELAQNEADYLRKKILYEQSEDEVTSRRNLFRIKASTLEEVKEAERNYEKAKIDYELSKNNYETGLKLYGEEKNLREKSLQLSIEKAENNLLGAINEKDILINEHSRYSIKSPVSGMVAELYTARNHSVSLQRPEIARIMGVGKINIKTNISESDVSSIKPGDEVTVWFDALKKDPFYGKIISIRPVIDSASRTFPVRIEVNNLAQTIKPGMFARVDIADKGEAKALWISTNSIRKTGNVSYVFRVRENTALRTNITTGRQSEGMTEVLSGLAAGETIITEGVDRITDMAKIEVIR